MAIRTHPLTYDDLAAMPEDEYHRYELIDGELIVSPSPILRHQRASRWLFLLLHGFVAEHDLGEVFTAPTDVILSPTQVVIPDLVYVSHARSAITANGAAIAGAPDLVVEILSPSSRSRDRVRKAQLYADFGVPEYWLTDAEFGEFFLNVLRDGRYQAAPAVEGRVRSVVLSGLEVDTAALFADLG